MRKTSVLDVKNIIGFDFMNPVLFASPEMYCDFFYIILYIPSMKAYYILLYNYKSLLYVKYKYPILGTDFEYIIAFLELIPVLRSVLLFEGCGWVRLPCPQSLCGGAR